MSAAQESGVRPYSSSFVATSAPSPPAAGRRPHARSLPPSEESERACMICTTCGLKMCRDGKCELCAKSIFEEWLTQIGSSQRIRTVTVSSRDSLASLARTKGKVEAALVSRRMYTKYNRRSWYLGLFASESHTQSLKQIKTKSPCSLSLHIMYVPLEKTKHCRTLLAKC